MSPYFCWWQKTLFLVKSSSSHFEFNTCLLWIYIKWDLGVSLPLPRCWSAESCCTDVHVVIFGFPACLLAGTLWSSISASLTQVSPLVNSHLTSRQSNACASVLPWPHLGSHGGSRMPRLCHAFYPLLFLDLPSKPCKEALAPQYPEKHADSKLCRLAGTFLVSSCLHGSQGRVEE